jgi:shikimate 5-dehydrogenase
MPVDHSRGDVFHRDASLREDGGRTAYVKIPVSPAELDNALHLLPTLGVRGLSVTSPLKRAVAASNFVGVTGTLESGNTLSLIKGSFLLYDTDEDGMRAMLRDITDAGAERGSVALFGSGGVAAAVLRALDAEHWGPVTTVSARDGWAEYRGASFALVIDASGPGSASRTHPPQSAAWIDLHYRDLDPPPPGVRHYRNGSLFFTVQARRQREIWALGDSMLDPSP